MRETGQLDPLRDDAVHLWRRSVMMLRAVLEGQTYQAVAAEHAISRTAVERRIKAVARVVAANACFEGLNVDGASFVRRLRLHRDAVLAMIGEFDASSAVPRGGLRILSDEDIASGAQRIRGRSHRSKEDLALYYVLLATGARPLEIARLEVRDYLNDDGSVRRTSQLRAESAITGRARPLYFRSARLEEAMDAYLAERVRQEQGLGKAGQFRHLDPESRLFVSASGTGFEIVPYGSEGQRRFRCRAIQETYRKLFRYAELKDVTALSVRHTVAARSATNRSTPSAAM